MKTKTKGGQGTMDNGQRRGLRTAGLWTGAGAFVLCLLSFVLPAAEEESHFGSIIGVTKIESASRQTVFAVSYAELGGTEEAISVSNLVKTTNLTVGDQLAVFNGKDYDTWLLRESEKAEGRSVKTWAKNEKTFVIDENGELVEGEGPAAADAKLDVGAGVWLIRQNPTNEHGQANAFYICGSPVDNPSFRIPPGATVLIGNPGQTAATPTVSGMQIGDRISIPRDGTVPLIYSYSASRTASTPSSWRYQNPANHRYEEGLPTLSAGEGCWYQAASNEGVRTITWKGK